MPAKHTTVWPLRRYSFIAGASTLLVVLVSWVAVRAVGPAESDNRVPLMVQPTVPLGGAAPTLVPSAVPSLSPSAVAPSSARPTSVPPTKRRSPSPSPSVSLSRKATTKPAPRRTTAAVFTAAYRLGGTWDRGFIAGIEVTNKSGPARPWTVTVTFDPDHEVRVRNVWNAQVTRQGDTVVLTGGPLAPGATAALGFEASKQVRHQIEPASCTVDGAPCRQG